MHVLTLTALLVGLAAAAPAPAPSATSVKLFDNIVVVSTALPCSTSTATPVTSPYWTPSARERKTCDESSYNASEAPKDVNRGDFRDCASLLSAFGLHNGTFHIPASKDDAYGAGYVDLVTSDSCTFAVRAEEALKLGDGDVDYIVHQALLDYSAGFMMAAQGDVKCAVEAGGKNAAMQWRIYNATAV
ncbi:hypothetical protein ACJ41O_014641 [Fusarium nematophilum]